MVGPQATINETQQRVKRSVFFIYLKICSKLTEIFNNHESGTNPCGNKSCEQLIMNYKLCHSFLFKKTIQASFITVMLNRIYFYMFSKIHSAFAVPFKKSFLGAPVNSC